jgi:hypothetical protein
MPSFPYKSNSIGEFFYTDIRRNGANEPDLCEKEINMINLCGDCDKILRINIKQGDEIYYHGTDAQSAKSILEDGIILKPYIKRHDFSCGNAFYLTPTFDRALDWGLRKSKKCQTCRSYCL